MMTLRTLLLLAVLAALACSSPEERAVEARVELEAALARQDRGAALLALKELRESLPDTPESLKILAPLMNSMGEGPEAVWLVEAQVAKHPDDDSLKLLLGQMALASGDPARAAAALEQIPPTSDQHSRALLGLSRARLNLGDRDAAFALLEEAEQLYPDDPGARLARVVALISEKKFDEALVFAEQGREKAEDDNERLQFDIYIARSYASQKEADKAMAVLEPLVEANPDVQQLWLALIHLYLSTDNAERARERLEKAIEESPDNAMLHTQLARTYTALGEGELAEEQRTRFLELADSPSAYFRLAEVQVSLGDLGRAAELLATAIERFPDTGFLRAPYAEVLIGLGRLDEAREQIDEFERLAPERSPAAEYLRARVDLAEGKVHKARLRLDRVVPQIDNAPVQFWLGYALEREGDLDGAKRRYILAYQHDATQVDAVEGLLRISMARRNWADVARYGQLMARAGRPDGADSMMTALLEMGAHDAAEEAARQILKRQDDDVQSHILLVRALRAGGKLDEAETTLDGVEQRFGPSNLIILERAHLLALQGHVDQGIALLEAAIEEQPYDPSLWMALAALEFERGGEARGIEAIDRTLELAPSDPAPLRLRAIFLASVGKPATARPDFERYLAKRPEDGRTWFMLGVVSSQVGDLEGAIAAYRRAAELDEKNVAARNNLALALAETGNLEEGLRVAQEAYRISGGRVPQVNDTLGWLYLKQGLTERAIALLEEAHRTDPELHDAGIHLALAYNEADRGDDARALLEDIRLRAPEDAGVRDSVDEALHSIE